MAFLPYVPAAFDVLERILKLIRGVRANAPHSRNKELAALETDVGKLRDAIELQTSLLRDQETELADLRSRLALVEERLFFPWWKLKRRQP